MRLKRIGTTAIEILTASIILFSLQACTNNNPPAIYEDYGACPFECCVYREWTVTKDTTIHKDMKQNSSHVFNVSKGEEVVALTGVVITTRPGVAKVVKPITLDGRQLCEGDILYLLTYLGEGVYKIWHRGQIGEISSWNENDSIAVLSWPESVWWVQIKNKKGWVGWTSEPGNFGNKDACG